MEPAILDRYAILSPGHEPVPNGRQRHFVSPEHQFLTATVDDIFIFDGEPYVLEAKLSHIDLDDGLPYRVQAQIQWHMGMSGIHRGVAAVLFFTDIGRDVQIWDIEFDLEVFRALKNAALMFWMRNVRMGIAPRIDGHKATTAALKRIKSVDAVVDISHLAGIVEQLGQTKAVKKSVISTETELTNKVKFGLGTATCGQINGRDAVTWRTDKRGSKTFLIKKAFLPKGSDDE
jgi:predicted phage-related endonuclease